MTSFQTNPTQAKWKMTQMILADYKKIRNCLDRSSILINGFLYTCHKSLYLLYQNIVANRGMCAKLGFIYHGKHENEVHGPTIHCYR